MKNISTDYYSVKKKADELSKFLNKEIPFLIGVGVEINHTPPKGFHLCVLLKQAPIEKKIPKEFNGVKVTTQLVDSVQFA